MMSIGVECRQYVAERKIDAPAPSAACFLQRSVSDDTQDRDVPRAVRIRLVVPSYRLHGCVLDDFFGILGVACDTNGQSKGAALVRHHEALGRIVDRNRIVRYRSA